MQTMCRALTVFCVLALCAPGKVHAADGLLKQLLGIPDKKSEAPAEDQRFKGPADPADPDVHLKGEEPHRFAVTVVNARGGRRSGTIDLPADTVGVSAVAGPEVKSMTLRVRDIDRIEITSWQGSRRRNNGYQFVPHRANVLLRDGSVVQCRGAIDFLTRLVLRQGGRRARVYTWFYDYREKNRWRSSGEEDLDYPETHPHEETVVRIHFGE